MEFKNLIEKINHITYKVPLNGKTYRFSDGKWTERDRTVVDGEIIKKLNSIVANYNYKNYLKDQMTYKDVETLFEKCYYIDNHMTKHISNHLSPQATSDQIVSIGKMYESKKLYEKAISIYIKVVEKISIEDREAFFQDIIIPCYNKIDKLHVGTNDMIIEAALLNLNSYSQISKMAEMFYENEMYKLAIKMYERVFEDKDAVVSNLSEILECYIETNKDNDNIELFLKNNVFNKDLTLKDKKMIIDALIYQEQYNRAIKVCEDFYGNKDFMVRNLKAILRCYIKAGRDKSQIEYLLNKNVFNKELTPEDKKKIFDVLVELEQYEGVMKVFEELKEDKEFVFSNIRPIIEAFLKTKDERTTIKDFFEINIFNEELTPEEKKIIIGLCYEYEQYSEIVRLFRELYEDKEFVLSNIKLLIDSFTAVYNDISEFDEEFNQMVSKGKYSKDDLVIIKNSLKEIDQKFFAFWIYSKYISIKKVDEDTIIELICNTAGRGNYKDGINRQIIENIVTKNFEEKDIVDMATKLGIVRINDWAILFYSFIIKNGKDIMKFSNQICNYAITPLGSYEGLIIDNIISKLDSSIQFDEMIKLGDLFKDNKLYLCAYDIYTKALRINETRESVRLNLAKVTSCLRSCQHSEEAIDIFFDYHDKYGDYIEGKEVFTSLFAAALDIYDEEMAKTFRRQALGYGAEFEPAFEMVEARYRARYHV